jgi:hypothetical protein
MVDSSTICGEDGNLSQKAASGAPGGAREEIAMDPQVRALGETVLRVKNLARVKRFYTDVIGLDVLREFEGIAFLKVSDGYGGHTQIVGLFHESLPAPFPKELVCHGEAIE